jgi:hypothetical protein
MDLKNYLIVLTKFFPQMYKGQQSSREGPYRFFGSNLFVLGRNAGGVKLPPCYEPLGH